MKKLEKLVLQDVPKISESEQRCLLGGSGPDGWSFMLAPDGNWYCYPGAEAVVYGQAPGLITDVCGLKSIEEIYNTSSSTSGWAAIAMGVIAVGVSFINPFAGLFLTGAGTGTGIYSIGESNTGDKLSNAIFNLQQMGYECGDNLRYSISNNEVIKIWDSETGALLWNE